MTLKLIIGTDPIMKNKYTIPYYRIIGSWLIVGFFMIFSDQWLSDPLNLMNTLFVFFILFSTILFTAFGVSIQAEYLARELGEPYGTLILTLSIVAVEVILISSILFGPGNVSTIGSDSIFSVMMIIMNLVMGLCIIVGNLDHNCQTFNQKGTTMYLSLITMLTTIGVIVPNYINKSGELSFIQATGISILTAALYGIFLYMQIGNYRRFFIQPKNRKMYTRTRTHISNSNSNSNSKGTKSFLSQYMSMNIKTFTIYFGILLSLIIPIALLANYLAVVVNYGIKKSEPQQLSAVY